MRFISFLFALMLSMNLLAQYKISGTVVDEQNEALVGATVVLKSTSKGVVTNANGHFIIAGIDAGEYQLECTFIGYEKFLTGVAVNENTELSIVMKSAFIMTEEVFVSASRAGQKTPVASSSVSKEELETRNVGQDVPFLLSLTPSFVATSDAGTGVGYTNFRIRGTDANRVNVTVNGIPLNDAESHGVWWVNMPDFSSSVENIQVQRGVGTSTQGAAAFGASINMQSSQLEKDAYAEYNGSAGSFNTIKNTVRIGSGLLNNHWSIDARLSKIHSDGFVDRANSDLKSFFVSGGYYSEKTIVKLNIFSGKEITYQAWNGVPLVRLNNDLAGMQRYADHWLYTQKQVDEMRASDSRTYNLYTYENEIDNYQQDHYQFLVNHQFNEVLSMNAALHYTYGRGFYEQFREGDDFADYGLNGVIIGNDTIGSSNFVRQKWLDNDFYGGTFSMNYNKENLDATVGGGWNKYDGRHFGKVIWADLMSTQTIDGVNLENAKDYEWYRGTGVKTDFNIYAKVNYALSDVFSIYGDIQYRHIDYTIDGIDDDYRDLTQAHVFDFVNPKLGVFAQIDDRSNAYASWSVGNREPSRSNFVDADPNGEEPTFETLNDFEAGYKYQGADYAFGANLYFMNYKNQLILTGEINDVGSAIMTNVDNSYRAGIELMAGLKVTDFVRWDVNMTLSQNKILNFVEYVDNWDTWGQEAYDLGTTNIAFSPNVIMNSQLKISPIKNFEFAFISQYVGKQYIDNTSSDLRKLDAYFVNNCQFTYRVETKLFEDLTFNLLVNNLLNTEYESNAWVYSYILGNERFEMDGYYPQAGTNFLLGVNIRF